MPSHIPRTPEDIRDMLKLVNNWGNYGAYGWGLGVFQCRADRDFVVQIGPFKFMFRY